MISLDQLPNIEAVYWGYFHDAQKYRRKGQLVRAVKMLFEAKRIRRWYLTR